MKQSINTKLIIRIIAEGVIIALTFYLVNVLLDEEILQTMYMFFFLLLGALILTKVLKISGMPELITAIGSLSLPFLTKLFADSPFAKHVAGFYNAVVAVFLDKTGIKTDYKIGYETAISLTFWLLFIVLILYLNRDHTAMKVRKGSDEQEFKQKNFAQKSEMFCKTLRQRLEAINRETDWNESLFTPIEAEVEVNIRGKHKKKFEDLLKCLKSIRHKGAIFLVLGEPGAGKSVSLRKLCLELLDESKETKKIPVYINLKKWNKDWNLTCLPTKKDLIDFIKTILYENGDFFSDGFLDTYFDKMLEDGRWYFIFDSFDEMPCFMGKQNCQELIDRISELLCQFMTGANQSGGIIASRMYKSPSEAIGATVVLKIQEFNDIKIKTMLQKYLNNADEVIGELFGKRENLVVLSRNPFYLTLLINYIQDKGLDFPKSQMELYQNFVEERLHKCAGKLESEHIDRAEVHNAAKKLAVYMQESSAYGLECPIDMLFQGEDENYWRKALKLLEYAKICRLGGQNETVSFVHRRFQEFFFVESIMERGEDIAYEEYKDIVNNASMRDALVLFCEVIEEEKAKEIAKFCWQVIQQNFVHAKNIMEKGCIELVNVLYFMTEAFRNRKGAIAEFREEFEELIDNALSGDTDFVVLLACTNSMVLFEQEYLQDMVLKVFRLRNRSLNDVVIQNCRVFNQLDSRIEKQFTIYFLKMNMRTFLERFRNVQFSLSLSKNFRYIKTIHFMLFLIFVSCTAVIFTSGLFAICHINKYIVFIRQFIEKNNIENLMALSSLSYGFEDKNLIIEFLVALCSSIILFLCSLQDSAVEYYIVSRFSWFCFLALMSLLIIYPLNKELGDFMKYGMYLLYFPPCLIIFCHEIYYLLRQKNIKKLWNMEKLKIFYTSFIPVCIVAFVVIHFNELMNIILIGCMIILFVLVGFTVVIYVISYIYDWNWIRKQTELRSITRENVDQNIKTLRLKRFRRAYVEGLLQQKVQLIGEWSDNMRPKYEDDKLEVLLARLDCLSLESYNYLF